MGRVINVLKRGRPVYTHRGRGLRDDIDADVVRGLWLAEGVALSDGAAVIDGVTVDAEGIASGAERK